MKITPGIPVHGMSKDGATSFLVWFEPQSEIKRTEGDTSEVAVRLLHPPPAEEVIVTLTVANPERIQTNVSTVTFRRDDWAVTQHAQLRFVNDERAYQPSEDPIKLMFASSPPSG